VSQEHQHLTTEQLSAFIDKQLSVEEQSQVDEHLKQCEQCQLWLKELRQTVMLVHALPQPQLPRSFALPADILVAPLPAQTEHTSHVTSIPRARFSRVRTTIRVVSTLAAVVGIVFLLSGFLSLSHIAASSATATSESGSGSSASSASSSSSTSAGVSNQAPQAKQAATPRPISTAMSTSISQATASFAPQATASAELAKQPGPAQNSPSSPAPSVSLFDLTQSSGRINIGMLLLILGGVGFIYLRFQHDRSNTTGS
jgi:predicted anti-sigma-YlaC factor YlaD